MGGYSLYGIIRPLRPAIYKLTALFTKWSRFPEWHMLHVCNGVYTLHTLTFTFVNLKFPEKLLQKKKPASLTTSEIDLSAHLWHKIEREIHLRYSRSSKIIPSLSKWTFIRKRTMYLYSVYWLFYTKVCSIKDQFRIKIRNGYQDGTVWLLCWLTGQR